MPLQKTRKMERAKEDEDEAAALAEEEEGWTRREDPPRTGTGTAPAAIIGT
jgi:hypothetical protein